MTHSSDYQKHQQRLRQARSGQTLADALPSKDRYDRVLLGDVSGIQQFIFNVKSKGASRTLKARSLFVQVLSQLCVYKLREAMGEAHTHVHLVGGGNFWLFYHSSQQAALEACIETIEGALVHEDIAVHIAHTDFEPDDFQANKRALYQLLGQKKSRPYASAAEKLFDPFETNDKYAWKPFTTSLVKANDYTLSAPSDASFPLYVGERFIELFGVRYTLTTTPAARLQSSVRNKLPHWTPELLRAHRDLYQNLDADETTPQENGAIEFGYLADMAGKRTGTTKLGILKLDIDDLGLLFRGLKEGASRAVSEALSWFFDHYLNELLDRTFSVKRENEQKDLTVPYRDHIYVVFSGGDDCFLLGGWDAVFEFAGLLRAEFVAFAKAKEQKPVTLSAGLLVVDRNFPVVRFATLAEDALHEAKVAEPLEKGGFVKDKVNLFGTVIRWDEWSFVERFRCHLMELLLCRGESKGFLNRIKKSTIGFAALQRKGLSYNLHHARVWRFNYYIRNVKKKNQDYVTKHLVQEYERILLRAITTKKTTNPAVFPLAARWTELLTRKKQTD